VIQRSEAAIFDGNIANPRFGAGAVDHRCAFYQKIKHPL
jgi:hypothetical protein